MQVPSYNTDQYHGFISSDADIYNSYDDTTPSELPSPPNDLLSSPVTYPNVRLPPSIIITQDLNLEGDRPETWEPYLWCGMCSVFKNLYEKVTECFKVR
jgi:hypothetical protein